MAKFKITYKLNGSTVKIIYVKTDLRTKCARLAMKKAPPFDEWDTFDVE